MTGVIFFNKASLLHACLETKIILWCRQGWMVKFANSKHEHRTENQSLVDSTNFIFPVHCPEKITLMQKFSHFLC